MSIYINKLKNKVKPPYSPMEFPNAKDWDHIESLLKLSFPVDLKEILYAYGSGIWFEDIFIFNPIANDWRSRLDIDTILKYNNIYK